MDILVVLKVRDLPDSVLKELAKRTDIIYIIGNGIYVAGPKDVVEKIIDWKGTVAIMDESQQRKLEDLMTE